MTDQGEMPPRPRRTAGPLPDEDASAAGTFAPTHDSAPRHALPPLDPEPVAEEPVTKDAEPGRPTADEAVVGTHRLPALDIDLPTRPQPAEDASGRPVSRSVPGSSVPPAHEVGVDEDLEETAERPAIVADGAPDFRAEPTRENEPGEDQSLLAELAVASDDPTLAATAWDHPGTRADIKRMQLPSIAALVVGVLAVVGLVATILLGWMEQVWGVPLMVVLAGLAGGCLMGAAFALAHQSRIRRILKQHPWRDRSALVGPQNLLMFGSEEDPEFYQIDSSTRDVAGAEGTQLVLPVCGRDQQIVVALGEDRTPALAHRRPVPDA